MATTRVRAHERVRDGKTEHVREHSRRVHGGAGGAEEPNPEEEFEEIKRPGKKQEPSTEIKTVKEGDQNGR